MSDSTPNSNPLPASQITGTGGGRSAPGRIRGARQAARAGQLAWVAEQLSFGNSDAQVIKLTMQQLGVPQAYAYKLVKDVYAEWKRQADGLIANRKYKLEEILFGVITDERTKVNSTGGTATDNKVVIAAVGTLIKLYGLDNPKNTVNVTTRVNNNSIGQDNPGKVRARIRELLENNSVKTKLAALNLDPQDIISEIDSDSPTPSQLG